MSDSLDYHRGALAMAAALAVKQLPREPKEAKRVLERTLREYLPVTSPEVREMLEEAMKR